MKKIILSCFVFVMILVLLIVNIRYFQDKKQNHLTKITVAEVAHSVFYAPQYLADSLGYFKDEGIDVKITLSNGADAVMAAVLSGDADIGFCGTEATIYVDGKKRNRLSLFQYK